MEDVIRIRGLQVYAFHGVLPQEKEQGQMFVINADLYGDFYRAAKEDDLSQSADYGAICIFLRHWMRHHTKELLETVAQEMALEVLRQYPAIDWLEMEVGKKTPPIPLPLEGVSVCVRRGWVKAYLGLGANLGQPEAQIRRALGELEAHGDVRLLRLSSLEWTKPYGGVEQGDFLNGVAEIETLLPPEELLALCQRLEAEAGRQREQRWGPRTLDLDILFYGQGCVDKGDLRIPHGDLANRAFVLEPLCQLAPGLTHPAYGRTVAQLLEALKRREG